MVEPTSHFFLKHVINFDSNVFKYLGINSRSQRDRQTISSSMIAFTRMTDSALRTTYRLPISWIIQKLKKKLKNKKIKTKLVLQNFYLFSPTTTPTTTIAAVTTREANDKTGDNQQQTRLFRALIDINKSEGGGGRQIQQRCSRRFGLEFTKCGS